MRGVTSMGHLLIPLLLGLLLDLVASNASAFQITGKNDATVSSSSMHAAAVTATITRRKNASIHHHLYASRLDADTGLLANGKLSSSSSSRRTVLVTALSGVAAAAAVGASTINNRPPSLARNSVSSGGAAIIGMTVDEAIAWIDENCDRRFLQAVVASDYHFLYRGVTTGTGSSSSFKISVMHEKPDLLLPETYGYSQDALEFFRQLEIVLKDDPGRPSNGHLATTSAEDAAAWGTTAASIWPKADADVGPVAVVHYAWFQDHGLFWPRRVSNNASSRGFLDRKSIIVDGRDCGKDSLDDALTRDSCEVMVATRSFLAVPVSMEKELKDRLRYSFLV